MRILFDTNVLISSFLFKGFAARVYDHCVLFNELYSSSWILDELHEKLHEKFGLTDEEVIEILTLVRERTEILDLTNALPEVAIDKDDNNVLRAAEFAQVDYVITGDKELLEMKNFGRAAIVSPREFFDRFIR